MKKRLRPLAIVLSVMLAFISFSACLRDPPTHEEIIVGTGRTFEDITAEFEGLGFIVSASAGNGYRLLQAYRSGDGAWLVVVQFEHDALATAGLNHWRTIGIPALRPDTPAERITFVRDGRNLAFVSGGAEFTPAPLEHMTLRMLGGGTQWSDFFYWTLLNDFVEAFNAGGLGAEAERLNVTIQLAFHTDIEGHLLIGDNNPNTIAHLAIWDRFVTPQFAHAGRLLPIDDFVNIIGIDTDDFVQPALGEMRFHTSAEPDTSRLFGLPLDVDTWGIYVNLNQIRTHNTAVGGSGSPRYVDITRLSNTWTWYDYIDIARRLTGMRGGQLIRGATADDMHNHLQKFMVSTGQDIFVRDANGDLVTSPNFIAGQTRRAPYMYTGPAMDEALSFLWEMTNATGVDNNHLIHRSDVETIHFLSGEVQLFTAPTYFINELKAHNNGVWYAANEVVFLPQPAWSCMTGANVRRENAVNGGMIGGFSLVTPQLLGSPSAEVRENWVAHAHRAAMVMDWWTRGEGGGLWSQHIGSLSAVYRFHEDEYLTTSVARSAREFVDYYRPRPNAVGFLGFQVDHINSHVNGFVTHASPAPNTPANRQAIINHLASGARNSTFI